MYRWSKTQKIKKKYYFSQFLLSFLPPSFLKVPYIRELTQRGRERERRRLRKLYFWFVLCGPLEFCFFALNFVNRKVIKCFSMKLNKYWKNFCCYVLVVPTTLKKVFSRCNFSDNFVQVLSSMHSNVQLLYLLLFFAVVGVAVFVA